MFPFYSSIYQPARPMTLAEQREADVRAGELAKAFAELKSSLCAPVRALRRFVMHALSPDGQAGLAAYRCVHTALPDEKRALAGGQPCRLCQPRAC
jgi:hypothetical protein